MHSDEAKHCGNSSLGSWPLHHSFASSVPELPTHAVKFTQ